MLEVSLVKKNKNLYKTVLGMVVDTKSLTVLVTSTGWLSW